MFRKLFENLFAMPTPDAPMLVRLYTTDDEGEEQCFHVGVGNAELNLTASDMQVTRVHLPILRRWSRPDLVPALTRATIALPEFPDLEINVRAPMPIFCQAELTGFLFGDIDHPIVASISSA